jgi:hypothetical protein
VRSALADDGGKNAARSSIKPDPSLDAQRVTTAEVEGAFIARIDHLRKAVGTWEKRCRALGHPAGSPSELSRPLPGVVSLEELFKNQYWLRC